MKVRKFMFPDPLSPVIYRDDNRFANIEHRISGQLPDGWSIKKAPPGLGLMGYKYILGLGPMYSDNDPIIAIRYFGHVTDLESLVQLVKKDKLSLGPIRNRMINAAATKELTYTDLNTKMLVILHERNHEGYGIELWTENIEKFRPIYDEFVHSLNWEYQHKPRTLGEFMTTRRMEHQEELGPIGRIITWIIGVLLIYALYRYFLR
jgi:hypothetical protein